MQKFTIEREADFQAMHVVTSCCILIFLTAAQKGKLYKIVLCKRALHYAVIDHKAALHTVTFEVGEENFARNNKNRIKIPISS